MANERQAIGPKRDRVRWERRGPPEGGEVSPAWDETEEDWSQGVDWETQQIGDGAGNFDSGWFPRGSFACEIRELRGGEAVIGARLQGTSTCLVIVRASRLTRTISTEDRLIDLRNNRVLNIRQAPPPDRHNWITLLCDTGVADG